MRKCVIAARRRTSSMSRRERRRQERRERRMRRRQEREQRRRNRAKRPSTGQTRGYNRGARKTAREPPLPFNPHSVMGNPNFSPVGNSGSNIHDATSVSAIREQITSGR